MTNYIIRSKCVRFHIRAPTPLNGVFALSELAVVSARKARLEMLADRGVAGARAAMVLSENPGKFLSTVQIGIMLVGIVAGAFSGATLGSRMSAGVRADIAEVGGYILVIGIITYLSVIIGELVPKHLALKNPERIACAVAKPMNILSRIAAPAVWLLDASTRGVFKLFYTKLFKVVILKIVTPINYEFSSLPRIKMCAYPDAVPASIDKLPRSLTPRSRKDARVSFNPL